eukprot:TRINITY_DN15599_c0_g1_i2.p1 TRINITY_DN15599_c0_g1~~TRINITY_DN15599_c0_g1_i2.p1  ORF type:complete len:104 (+),score=27.15 TRINITY_DN15599_c0_g1_i2:176-487(+)
MLGYLLATLANEKSFCKGRRPNPLRKILFYGLFLGTYAGVMACCTICSREFGWYFSCSWLWTFLLGFVFDLLVYEPLIWAVYMLTEKTVVGRAIRMMKAIKTA